MPLDLALFEKRAKKAVKHSNSPEGQIPFTAFITNKLIFWIN